MATGLFSLDEPFLLRLVIFGEDTGDPMVDRILLELRKVGELGIMRTVMLSDIFQRNL